MSTVRAGACRLGDRRGTETQGAARDGSFSENETSHQCMQHKSAPMGAVAWPDSIARKAETKKSSAEQSRTNQNKQGAQHELREF